MQPKSQWFPNQHRRRCRTGRAFRPRRAAIVLELILVLPILVILVLAVVQFGLFFANIEQVALAARVGAEEASQTVDLPITDGAPIPANILEAIDHQLDSSGIIACRVRLEHNLGGQQVTLIAPPTGACDCPPAGNLTPPLPPGEYVRLSLSVPLCELMPNCLAVFGFDVADPCKVVEATTIFRHELGP